MVRAGYRYNKYHVRDGKITTEYGGRSNGSGSYLAGTNEIELLVSAKSLR